MSTDVIVINDEIWKKVSKSYRFGRNKASNSVTGSMMKMQGICRNGQGFVQTKCYEILLYICELTVLLLSLLNGILTAVSANGKFATVLSWTVVSMLALAAVLTLFERTKMALQFLRNFNKGETRVNNIENAETGEGGATGEGGVKLDELNTEIRSIKKESSHWKRIFCLKKLHNVKTPTSSSKNTVKTVDECSDDLKTEVDVESFAKLAFIKGFKDGTETTRKEVINMRNTLPTQDSFKRFIVSLIFELIVSVSSAVGFSASGAAEKDNTKSWLYLAAAIASIIFMALIGLLKLLKYVAQNDQRIDFEKEAVKVNASLSEFGDMDNLWISFKPIVLFFWKNEEEQLPNME